MKSEQVILSKGEISSLLRIDEIIVPDIRPWGLCVTEQEHEVLLFAYKTAKRVYNRILKREKEKAHKEPFEIDIPDLWFIAKKIRPGHRDEIMEFSMIFQALVQYFIQKANKVPYSYDGKTQHGIKYKGLAWVSTDE